MERRWLDFDTLEHCGEVPLIEERADGDVVRFTGLASVFYDGTERTQYTLWDSQRGKAVERIMPTAFDETLRSGGDVAVLFNHDSSAVLGRRSAGTAEITKEARGLRYRFMHDPNDPDHQRLRAKVNRKDITGSSFGFLVTKDSWKFENNVNVREIHSVRLIEVSPVTFPAFAAATIGMRSVGMPDEAVESFRRNETQKRLEMLRQMTT